MNAYEMVSAGYVLLDSGTMPLGIVKMLGIALAWHVAVKAVPAQGSRRWLTGVAIGVLLAPVLFWSLQADRRQSWLALGHHFLATRDEVRSLEAYSKAWDAGDRSPVLYRQLMSLTCRRDRLEEALNLASEALQIFPNEQEILLTAAEIRLFARDFPGAIESARRATVEDADLGKMMRAYLVWAKALVHAGRPAEAIAVLREEQGRLPSPEARELLEREIRSLEDSPPATSSHGGAR